MRSMSPWFLRHCSAFEQFLRATSPGPAPGSETTVPVSVTCLSATEQKADLVKGSRVLAMVSISHLSCESIAAVLLVPGIGQDSANRRISRARAR